MSTNQRDYRTNESDTARQFKEGARHGDGLQLLQYTKSIHREDSRKIFQKQQKLLQEDFNRESGELKGNRRFVKIGSKMSDKGSVKSIDSKSKKKEIKKIESVNEVIEKIYGDATDQPTNNYQPIISTKVFEFKFIPFIIQVLLGYGITIGLMYLIQVTNFPFFQLLFIFGLMNSVSPWSKTNVIMLVACAIVIGNTFLSVQVLTYPAIIICYFSVLIFNEHHKHKIIFIPILICVFIWGFIVVPALYFQFVKMNNTLGFYYVFPFFVFMVRSFLFLFYRWIKYTQYIFLQLPLFVLGMEYGVMMTLSVGSIQFWYLMVFFTLQIANDRSQFLLELFVAMGRSCDRIRTTKKKRTREEQLHPLQPKSDTQRQSQQSSKPQPKTIQKDLSILPSHASGYNSLNSLHIICITYTFTKLPLYSSPYTKGTALAIYIASEWYIPLVIWALSLVYEIMCLILERRRKDKLLIGWTGHGVKDIIMRGFMLAIGLWMFYLGLGIGNYAVNG